MPGRIHVHKVGGKRILVYHRKGGALRIHGRDHSRRSLSRDRKRPAWGSYKRGYPHAGDKTKPIKAKKGRYL